MTVRFRVARGRPRVHRREEAPFVGDVWVGCRFINDLFKHTQMLSLGIKLRAPPSWPADGEPAAM
jgi:hypothetical protein